MCPLKKVERKDVVLEKIPETIKTHAKGCPDSYYSTPIAADTPDILFNV